MNNKFITDAAKSGVAQETLQNAARRAGKVTMEQEARQILGKYDVLFEKNAKNGSFYIQSKVHRAKECLEAVYRDKGEGTLPTARIASRKVNVLLSINPDVDPQTAAYGLSIVAAKNGGLLDIHRVLDNGLLVDPHDQQFIPNALLKLVVDRLSFMMDILL
ncbi:hypothetical protein CRYUN_Cryun40dG0047400 [Craigia yunnanensis]